jgi:multidrug efflux pump subunit AcrA (membrane-fusion protein)
MQTMKSFLYSLLLFFLIACSHKQEKTKVSIENITESVYASGVVKSRNQYEAFATVNGLVKKRLVKEGDIVTNGQPIISLVNETPRLSAENAQLGAAYASVAANRDKLNELRINIDLARSKMQNDSSLYERQKNLWAQQIGTRFDLEQRQLAYQNSTTAYRSAILRYNDLQKQINLTAQQAQKNAQISSTVLNDYTIKSKLNGKVYTILKEEGEMVNVQTPIAIIGDANDFLLELQVDEYDIGRIRLGQTVLVSMDSYKGQTFEAVIEKIDPIMNERSRTFKVEAGFTKKPPQLYPNLTVEANIIIQVKQNALTIPRNYLIDDSLVLLENKEKRKVVTGVKDYQKAEIINGLQKDEVILKPAQ